MTWNTDIARSLFRELFAISTVESQLIIPAYMVGIPRLPGFAEEVVRLHVERFLEVGLVSHSDVSGVKGLAGPPKYRPTATAESFARYAWDDHQWLSARAGLQALLDRGNAARPGSAG